MMCVRSGLTMLGCASALSLSGCFGAAPLENEVTWAIKAVRGELTQATATEWQAVSVRIDAWLPEVDVSLSDAQASTIVVFVQENEIEDVQDILETTDRAQSDPNSIVIPDGFIELFAGFGEADFDELLGTLQE
jgi:hypothetical protein